MLYVNNNKVTVKHQTNMSHSLHTVTDSCNTSLENNNYSILLKACGFVIMTIKEALVDYLLLFDVFIRF